MSAPLLFRMFKSKTGFPLHAAVRLQREDVVFLYLVENSANVSINGFILFVLLACSEWFGEQYANSLLHKCIEYMNISGCTICLHLIIHTAGTSCISETEEVLTLVWT